MARPTGACGSTSISMLRVRYILLQTAVCWAWLIPSVDSFVSVASFRHSKSITLPPMLAVQTKAAGQNMKGDAVDLSSTNSTSDDRTLSLASSYRVDVSLSTNDQERWLLTPIQHWNGTGNDNCPEGAMAAAALQQEALSPAENTPISLVCTREDSQITCCAGDEEVESSLAAVLLRIMVQKLKRTTDPKDRPGTISFPGEPLMTVSNTALSIEESVRTLFEPLLDTSSVEMVEMVSQHGDSLGMVPRPLVHSFNLLHRGIGMVVTKDVPIVNSNTKSFPDLYVHRRTDTKRIFPSLYDMFVGGVSSANEDARTTAAREVSEELGLSRALVDDKAMLSDPLFDCIVCTSYNRCFVTVFCCTFESSKDVISWQEEEVTWGDFVPYQTIVQSARMCIARMVASGTWPGSRPYALEQSNERAMAMARLESSSDDKEDWKSWDYVPDGLLVWEAWLRWQNDKKLGV